MTTNVRNQGIAHIATKPGGVPWCRSRRAHIVTTPDRISQWPRVCAKCAAILEKARARSDHSPAQPACV